MHAYSNFLDILQKLLYGLIVGLFAAMVALVFAQVVMRYGFSMGFTWIEESSRYLFIWQVMLATPIALRYGRHMKIDTLLAMVPPLVRNPLKVGMELLIMVFILLFTLSSFEFTVSNSRGISSGIRVSMGYAYAALIAGGVLMFLYWVEGILNLLRARTPLGSRREG